MMSRKWSFENMSHKYFIMMLFSIRHLHMLRRSQYFEYILSYKYRIELIFWVGKITSGATIRIKDISSDSACIKKANDGK